ncbi:MAG: TlpA disulfide reductase family protein [Candidatus Omnitrophota bacterium]
MKKRKFVKMLIMVAPVLLLCAAAWGADVSSAAPDISASDMAGNAVKLSDFKGKVILLNFFAKWCPPCRQEIPDFVALQKQYGDKGLAIIGVSLTPAKDVKPFAEKEGINYPVLIGDAASDAAYGPIRSIPTTFLIDKDFRIAEKYIGSRSKEVFESDIKELLSQ